MEWILLLAMSCVDQIVANKMSAQPPSVETIIERWATAADAAKKVDVKFQVRQYDDTFHALKIGEGRFYADSATGSVVWSIFPATENPVDIQNFTTRPHDALIWLWSPVECLHIDPTKMTAYRVKFPAVEQQLANPPSGLLQRFTYNLQTYFRSSPKIASGIFLDADMIRGIPDHADLTVTESNGSWVLSGKAHHEMLTPHMSSFKLMFTSTQPFPVAAQIVNPARTKRTVYILQKPSINRIPEDVEDLLHPDLAGYRIHTIE